jgi:hypothetical protein
MPLCYISTFFDLPENNKKKVRLSIGLFLQKSEDSLAFICHSVPDANLLPAVMVSRLCGNDRAF